MKTFIVHALWLDHGFYEFGYFTEIFRAPNMNAETAEREFLKKFKVLKEKKDFRLFEVKELIIPDSPDTTTSVYAFSRKDRM